MASHVTPADGNVFLDLGFEPGEAARLLADSQKINEGKLAQKATLARTSDDTNVYADLGYADADAMQRKSGLAAEIAHALEERHLTPAAACELLEIDQTNISAITRGQFRDVSEAELLGLVAKLRS